jgi:hyperosmotically inducible periplasmic protein
MRKHIVVALVIALGFFAGCSTQPKMPDVSDQIRNSLDQAGLKDVSVSQDRDKGVITLTGTTPSEGGKSQAELIAKTAAPSDVVANEIAVRPPGNDTASKVNSDLDKGIEKNLDAALVQHRLNKAVKYDVKNGVVTLTGNVRSQSLRDNVEKIAKAVPNVQQVVNELEIKNQKASSSD